MKVTRLHIRHWRNLRDIEINVDPEANLVCLVGDNGTGKSAILELLSAAAHSLGISQGIATPRGNPFGEEHDVTVEVKVSIETADLPESLRIDGWDGHIRLHSQAGHEPEVNAVGVPESLTQQLGAAVVGLLRQRDEVQHIYLDANRSYHRYYVSPNEYLDVSAANWHDPRYAAQFSFKPTQEIYTEWIKYLVGLEHSDSLDHTAAIREARLVGEADPHFVDPFEDYQAMLGTVLPHMQFKGVPSTSRAPVFNTAGVDLQFADLSGGEREIAFLVGQIERFKLRRGLMLVDEPELHLNADLLRTWLRFVRDTITDGQLWIATHSIDALEPARTDDVFVLERDEQTRLATSATPLADRPVLATLSRVLGSPAFGIHRRRIIFVEGDKPEVEPERFYTLIGDPDINRFVEGGSCLAVLDRVESARAIAAHTDDQVHVAGILDRDFRDAKQRLELQRSGAIHVLGCHEIENLYLHPGTVKILMEMRTSFASTTAIDLIRDCADDCASMWIWQYASAAAESAPPREQDPWASQAMSWSVLNSDWDKQLATAKAAVNSEIADSWGSLLDNARTAFEAGRMADDWWKMCCGKQTGKRLAKKLGLESDRVLTDYAHKIWADENAELPDVLRNLREFINSITVG